MSAGIRKRQDITCVKIRKVTSINSAHTEQILSKYIESRIDDSVTHQLKRIQRDLRGLPPLLRNSTTGEVVNADPDALENNDMIVDTMEVDGPKKDLNKEEKKRLKKERRKQEKKAKADKRLQQKDREEDGAEDEE
jgi:hypothetical protein